MMEDVPLFWSPFVGPSMRLVDHAWSLVGSCPVSTLVWALWKLVWPRRSSCDPEGVSRKTIYFHFSYRYLGHCGIAYVLVVQIPNEGEDPERRWRLDCIPESSGMYTGRFCPSHLLGFFMPAFLARKPQAYQDRGPVYLSQWALLTMFSLFCIPSLHYFPFYLYHRHNFMTSEEMDALSFWDKLIKISTFSIGKSVDLLRDEKKWDIMIKILGFIHHTLGFLFMWIFDQFLALICCFYTVILWGGRACTWM